MEIGKEYKGLFGLKYACVWRDDVDDTFALMCIDRRSALVFGEVFWVGENGMLMGIGGKVVPWTE